MRLALSSVTASRHYRLVSSTRPLRPLGVSDLQELAVVCGSYFLRLVYLVRLDY